MNMSALKIIISFGLILSYLFIRPASVEVVLAQTPTTPPPVKVEGQPVTADNYHAEQHSSYTVDNLGCALIGGLAGSNPCGQQIGRVKASNGELSLRLFDQVPGGGAIGAVTGTMVALYNPPTSTVQYLADIGRDLGITPAYAQVGGSGAGIIEPVRTLWLVARNIAYLAFILIFIIVGFMIMFRQKINPQTVVTAQAALPGLIIGIALVTFSYLIAALIIDLSFLGMQIVATLISQAAPGNAFGNAQELARNANILQMFGTTVTNIPFGDIASGFWDTIFGKTETWVIGGFLTGIVGAIIGTIIAPGLGSAIGFGIGVLAPGEATAIVGVIVPLILIIALFIQLFRLFFNLLGTYIQLLINTIIGPFILLAASLPGRGGTVTNWLKALLANALIFPAVFAAFLFAGVILSTTPESWKASPPLFGGMDLKLLRVLLAYGILLGLPAIPDTIRKAFKVEGLPGISQAAIGGFVGGAGFGWGAASTGYNRLWRGGARPGEPSGGPAATSWYEFAQRQHERGRNWVPALGTRAKTA
ncbi:MAG: hypothetical protein V1808_03100 [Candidatus Daviesbacteria bacterium]